MIWHTHVNKGMRSAGENTKSRPDNPKHTHSSGDEVCSQRHKIWTGVVKAMVKIGG